MIWYCPGIEGASTTHIYGYILYMYIVYILHFCLYCRGIRSESFAAFLNGMILFFLNTAVITAAVITTHHGIALRLRSKLRYLVICAVVTAAFF